MMHVCAEIEDDFGACLLCIHNSDMMMMTENETTIVRPSEMMTLCNKWNWSYTCESS